MNIYLTDHVINDVLPERIGSNPSKYPKLARKAWESMQPIGKGEIANPGYYGSIKEPTEYRKHMGYIYVFVTRPGAAVLVTLYPPSNRLKKPKPQYIPNH